MTVVLQLAASVLASVCVGALAYAAVTRSARALAGAQDGPLESLRRQRHLLGEQTDRRRLARLLPLAQAVGQAMPLQSLRRALALRYQQAGWPHNWTDEQLVGLAVMLGVPLAAAATLALLPVKPVLAPLGLLALAGGAGIFHSWLGDVITRRRLEISHAVPFVMDLMAVSLRAGASMQITMEQIASDYAAHPVGEEFAAVLADIRSGVTFTDALGHLRTRVPVREVQVFADDVIQSERMGRPIADTLEHCAARFKTVRIQAAREFAGKAKVAILIPGVLILFASLIVLFAPFALRFLKGGAGL